MKPATRALACLVVALLALAASGAAQSSPASGRQAILILPLTGSSTREATFADSVSTGLLKQLNSARQGRAMSWQEASANVPVQGLKPTCVIGRQAAVHLGVPLVLCATIRETAAQYTVEARVIASASQELVEIPRFRATSFREAAERLSNEVKKGWCATLLPPC